MLFPVLYSKSLLIVYFIYSSVYVNPMLLIYPHPLFSLCFLFVSLFLFL